MAWAVFRSSSTTLVFDNTTAVGLVKSICVHQWQAPCNMDWQFARVCHIASSLSSSSSFGYVVGLLFFHRHCSRIYSKTAFKDCDCTSVTSWPSSFALIASSSLMLSPQWRRIETTIISKVAVSLWQTLSFWLTKQFMVFLTHFDVHLHKSQLMTMTDPRDVTPSNDNACCLHIDCNCLMMR